MLGNAFRSTLTVNTNYNYTRAWLEVEVLLRVFQCFSIGKRKKKTISNRETFEIIYDLYTNRPRQYISMRALDDFGQKRCIIVLSFCHSQAWLFN